MRFGWPMKREFLNPVDRSPYDRLRGLRIGHNGPRGSPGKQKNRPQFSALVCRIAAGFCVCIGLQAGARLFGRSRLAVHLWALSDCVTVGGFASFGSRLAGIAEPVK